jgi:hypothetical protein
MKNARTAAVLVPSTRDRRIARRSSIDGDLVAERLHPTTNAGHAARRRRRPSPASRASRRA